VRLEATEEIYLTPVQRPPDPAEPTPAFLPPAESRMSVSSDPDPAAYPSTTGRPHPSISEEDEGFDCLSSPERADPPGGGWRGSLGEPPPPPRASLSSDTSALSYDSVKYTLVVDEHAQLELVSLRPCFGDYSDESDSATVYDNCASASSPYESAIGEEYEEAPRPRPSTCLSEDSTPDEPDVHFSKKFLNVFMSGRSRSSSESARGGGQKAQREPMRGSWEAASGPFCSAWESGRHSARPTPQSKLRPLLQPALTCRCRVLRAVLLCHQRRGAGANPSSRIQVRPPLPASAIAVGDQTEPLP
jgi:hypothetical protein